MLALIHVLVRRHGGFVDRLEIGPVGIAVGSVNLKGQPGLFGLEDEPLVQLIEKL